MSEDLFLILGFGLLSTIFIFYAQKKGFFSSPPSHDWNFPIRWYHVIALFAVYFATLAFIVPILSFILKKNGVAIRSINGAVWLNFLSSFLIIIFMTLYQYFFAKNVSEQVWGIKNQEKISNGIKFGALAWLISFPLVIFSNQLFDYILHEFFHVSLIPEQLAVRFLKMTFQNPLHFSLTTISIVIFAPIIEETLFRGFLQSFIRQHLGVNHSIVITALCFSLFHYSSEQGMGNISIIASLFILALFLGYVYDRKRTLVASITLHALFNLINVVNLFFFGGFPKGPYI